MIRPFAVSALLLAFAGGTFSQVITLQEGLADYAGCSDSYIIHSDYGPNKTLNFGADDSILTDICKT